MTNIETQKKSKSKFFSPRIDNFIKAIELEILLRKEIKQELNFIAKCIKIGSYNKNVETNGPKVQVHNV
jgi:hypothetical protein